MTALMWLSFTVSDQASGTTKRSEMTSIDQPRKRPHPQNELRHECTGTLSDQFTKYKQGKEFVWVLLEQKNRGSWRVVWVFFAQLTGIMLMTFDWSLSFRLSCCLRESWKQESFYCYQLSVGGKNAFCKGSLLMTLLMINKSFTEALLISNTGNYRKLV